MTHITRLFTALAFVAGLMGLAPASLARDLGPQPPSQFGFYVLSLSYVPGFCATHKDPNECGKGLSFGLHGLWPETTAQDYPTNCSHVALTPAIQQRYASVYASPDLIVHEWPKHGTCSGLTPDAYFQLSAADVKKVVIPPAYRGPNFPKTATASAVSKAFVKANRGLTAAGIQVIAPNSKLTEVRICLDKAGAFRSCQGS